MRRNHWSYCLFILVFTPLWLVSCTELSAPQPTPTLAPTETQAPTPTPVPTPFKPYVVPAGIPRSDRPAYANPGKYMVGLTSAYIVEANKVVVAYLWYPVKEDRTPDTAGAPYPLVIYSTGGWTNVSQYTYFLEVLASYGSVVMAVDPGDAAPDATDWSPTVINRIQDTRLLISQAGKMTAPGGQLAGLIDMDKIASTGYSAGGWTALVGAGAQWSFGWCAAHSYSSDYCGSDQQKLADAFGLKSVPDGLWPAMNDPRVKTVVAMAPVGWVFGAEFEGVSAIKVPALIIAATDDTICPADRGANAIYQHLGSQKKSLVQFDGKDHLYFWGQDMDRDLITHFLVAYLLAELKGNTAAAQALAPANVTLPDVQYETTEFK